MASQTASTPRVQFDTKELPAESPLEAQVAAEPNKTHPEFSSQDADVVLCSQDGMHFRVHSLILRLSSGWFRTLFTLPQSQPPDGSSTSDARPPSSSSMTEVIPMNEHSNVLSVLLSMASGKELPRLESIEFIEELLQTAEKYDMPGPASIIRLAITSPHLVQSHPIRVYAIACRWGWVPEAKIASSHTLHLDLLGASTLPELSHVSSTDLTKLMLLHRRRRDHLRKGLDSTDLFYANVVPGKCTGCNADIIHNRWHNLKYEWVAIVEEAPVNVASRDLLERSELLDVLDCKCPRCQKNLYNAESTLTNLRTILEELPTTVEFD